VSRVLLALSLGGIAAIVAATQSLSDTDMWWHLATGRETLAHGFVRTDVFSWTVRGEAISTDQWLGQVLMWLSYLAGGWQGIAMLRVALVAALITLVGLGAARAATRPLAIVLGIAPALLLTKAVWVDRPLLFGFVLFAAVLLLLREARQDGPSWTFVALPIVIGVWTQIHGSFALGVVLVVIACAEGALNDVTKRRAYLACAVASVLVTLANPAGIGAWTAPGSHLLSPPRDIQEWNVIDVRTPSGVLYVVTLALVIACVVLGPRVPLRELVILAPVVFLSMTAVRQAPLLAIAAAPLIAQRAELLLDRVGLRKSDRPLRLGPLAFASAIVPLVLIVAALVMSPGAPDESAYPVDARASIPLGDKTLARYEWGGWLIWSGVPVFVDGRLTPYAGEVLDDYRRIIAAAPGWEDAVARRGVRTLLVVPTDPVAIRAIELGWVVRFRSPLAVVIAVP
jgi:hypothetical protein